MNSSLQCLINIPQFTKIFNEETIQKDDLLTEFYNLIEQFKNSYFSISPKAFHSTFIKHYPFFEDFGQHDSHEFLKFFLEHVNLNLKHSNASETEIEKIFGGKFENITKCLKCKNETIKEEKFLDISLPLLMDSQHFSTVNECLDNFFKEESMIKSNQIYCEKCKSKTDGMKKVMLKKTPNILILHLCRFTYDLKKLNQNVELPLNLHLNQYSINDQVHDEYELKSVIHHFGNLQGGHYVSSCKNENNEWIVFDDSIVRNVRDIQSPSAYVLFYQKKKLNSNIL
eukprot:gene7867-12337_t